MIRCPPSALNPRAENATVPFSTVRVFPPETTAPKSFPPSVPTSVSVLPSRSSVAFTLNSSLAGASTLAASFTVPPSYNAWTAFWRSSGVETPGLGSGSGDCSGGGSGGGVLGSAYPAACICLYAAKRVCLRLSFMAIIYAVLYVMSFFLRLR